MSESLELNNEDPCPFIPPRTWKRRQEKVVISLSGELKAKVSIVQRSRCYVTRSAEASATAALRKFKYSHCAFHYHNHISNCDKAQACACAHTLILALSLCLSLPLVFTEARKNYNKIDLYKNCGVDRKITIIRIENRPAQK